MIVPIRNASDGIDLYLVDEDGARPLVHGEGDQRFPSLSRDLKMLQFATRVPTSKWDPTGGPRGW